MNCTACQRGNLAGGVRCVYCGVPLPQALDFDLGASVSSAAGPTNAASTGQAGKQTTQQSKKMGLWGSLALLLVKGKSLLALLKFGKIATTFLSMLAFIAVDARIFGWKFGVGIAVSILIHEMGHVFVNWRKGLKQTAPMFIPFVGAVIFIKQFPDDPTVQSESGAGGPAAGALAALACLLIGLLTQNAYWMALANIGFAINLFNLIPFPPLDGSHIASVFSPKVWDVVLIGLLLWVLKIPSALLWFILVVGFLFRLGRGNESRYLLAAPATRVRMALVYLGLCLVLASGAQYTLPARSAMYQNVSTSARTSASVQDRDEDTSDTSPTAESADRAPMPKARTLPPALVQEIAWIVNLVVFGLAGLLWLMTGFLLSAAAGRRFRVGNFGMVAGMWGVLVVLGTCSRLGVIASNNQSPLLGACFAASLAALFYAGVQAARLRGRKMRPLVSALTGRCLAWAAGAALIIAYATSNLPTAGVTVLCILLYYARTPWMLASLVGTLAEQMGDLERSLALCRRAVSLRPDRESAADLLTRMAHLDVALARGGAALEALEERDSQFAPPPATVAASAPVSVADLILRSSALALLDRHQEALACCERILQAPAEDPLANARLLLVHAQLADMAALRGWWDESLAQADWCLRALPNATGRLIAVLNGVRAEALIRQGQAEAARMACDKALAASREPQVEARIATIRAQSYLHDNDPAGAERETARALRLLPGSLAIRYWRGQTLLAAGRRDEGKERLRALANDYPNEHWGKQARAVDAPFAFVSVPEAARVADASG